VITRSRSRLEQQFSCVLNINAWLVKARAAACLGPACAVLWRICLEKRGSHSPEMGHLPPSTRAVAHETSINPTAVEYWNDKRGARLLPRREDIEPEAIRFALADTFILSFAPHLGHPVRVAGTRVCALFGREMKGEAFLGAFSSAARREMTDLISVIADESVGVVARATEQDHGTHTLGFEFLLLPLSVDGTEVARLLGVLVALDARAWQHERGLAKLTLGSYRFVGGLYSAGPFSSPRPQPSRRLRLVVYEGGQSSKPA
jgi:hypothetical protein